MPGSGSKRLSVALCVGSELETKLVHRLVLEAFVGPCPPGLEGCHRNDDSSDNRLENLYWGTHRQNMADRERNGGVLRGEGVGNSKLSEERVRYAQQSTKLQKELAKELGVDQSVISRIRNGKSWRYLSPDQR
jgi:hypothetical protein